MRSRTGSCKKFRWKATSWTKGVYSIQFPLGNSFENSFEIAWIRASRDFAIKKWWNLNSSKACETGKCKYLLFSLTKLAEHRIPISIRRMRDGVRDCNAIYCLLKSFSQSAMNFNGLWNAILPSNVERGATVGVWGDYCVFKQSEKIDFHTMF